MGSLSRLGELCSSGFAIALHIRFTTPKLLFQTYPKAWMEIYSAEGLVLKDPTVLWGFSNTGTALWSSLGDLDAEGVLERAGKHGLIYGFTFAYDDGDSKSISSFSRDDREFEPSEIKTITEIVMSLHRATAEVEKLPETLQSELRSMSIEFSHA